MSSAHSGGPFPGVSLPAGSVPPFAPDLSEGPLLVFGGPYGNLQALQALMAFAIRQKISPGRILCTGDMAAYGADPASCIRQIRDLGIAVIAGNVERQLGTDEQDCGCNFPEGSTCDVLARSWYAHAREAVDPEDRAWMAGLPPILRFTLKGLSVVALHGDSSSDNSFVFASEEAQSLEAQCRALDADLVLAGHCGLPFTRVLATRNLGTRALGRAVWHNAGSIGLPANDGVASTWFSLLHDQGDGLRLSHHRLHYDHALAAARLRQSGLGAAGEAYARALETGLWPGLDILPDQERAATGQALDLSPVVSPVVILDPGQEPRGLAQWAPPPA